MKVNTDSIILGSWALKLLHNDFQTIVPQKTEFPFLRALDIGSGSGLLSLMLAQGFGERIVVDAIELDRDASMQGKENIANSPWSSVISSHCINVVDYMSSHKLAETFDVVISNPPYFPQVTAPTRAYSKQTHKRLTARNQTDLSLEQLIWVLKQALRKQGVAFIVLPSNQLSQMTQFAKHAGLNTKYQLAVKSLPHKTPYVNCLGLTREIVEPQCEELIIYQENHVYSQDYRALCGDFYKNF